MMMYRKTKQRLFLAEKFLERHDEKFALLFLRGCLDSVFDGLESDPPKALKKVFGALLLELSMAPFKPWNEMYPDVARDDFDLKEVIINLMRELSEESESNAELFYYYLRAAEKSQKQKKETKKKQETKQDNLNLENVYPLNSKGKSRHE